MQLSKLEHRAYELLRKNNLFVFKTRDLKMILRINETSTYNLIKSLKKKKAINLIKQGIYSLKDADEFLVGSYANWPAYVSFLSALNYYGYSDNVPNKILFASTKYSKDLNKFSYTCVSKSKFFGYIRIGDFLIADKEKAFIDSLMFPKNALGISHIIKCFKQAIKELDIKKLVEYASKSNVKAVIRRLGYILDILQLEKKYQEVLHKKIGKGYEFLDPTRLRKNNLNKRWLLDINLT